MSFPNYKKKGWWIFSRNVPDGWEDLGEILDVQIFEGDFFHIDILCGSCKTKINIGRENNKLFYFCPNCNIYNFIMIYKK